MKARLFGEVCSCIPPPSSLLSTARVNSPKHLIGMFVSLAVILIMTQAVSAAPVIYSVTSDDLVLNNPDGAWGGNLNVGAGQDVNLTVAYWYEANPALTQINIQLARFTLIGLQVFDNTNGLASAFIANPFFPDPFSPSRIHIRYDGVMDFQSSASYWLPGGGIFIDAFGEFGDVGDPLPAGSTFDMLVESSTLDVVARASVNDDIGPTDPYTLQPGSYSFHSQSVPIPPAVWLFGSGLLGLIGISRRKRAG